jgi:hypothetical protein
MTKTAAGEWRKTRKFKLSEPFGNPTLFIASNDSPYRGYKCLSIVTKQILISLKKKTRGDQFSEKHSNKLKMKY